MHVPDGFLDLKTAATTGLISAGTLAYATKKLQGKLEPARIPLLGVTGAFIFAAQMVNFPVVGGTSGHLLGAVLAAILLGPWAAVVVMTAVLVVQCFVFQDGGLLALGANILNMGITGALLGYWLYAFLAKAGKGKASATYAAAFAAAWCSVVAGAFLCSTELVLSGSAAAVVVYPAMLGVHSLIGIGEGLITVAALALLAHNAPEVWNPASLVKAGDSK